MEQEESFERENTLYSDGDGEADIRQEMEEYARLSDPYEQRRGRYEDDNDDLGVYYDEDDLRLANEEGTYLVPVRITVDEFGNRVYENSRSRGALSLKSYKKRAEREKVEPPAYVERDDFWSSTTPVGITSQFTLKGDQGREDEGDKARRLRLQAAQSSPTRSPLASSQSNSGKREQVLAVKPVGGTRLLYKRPPPQAAAAKASPKGKSSKGKPAAEVTNSGGKFASAFSRSRKGSSATVDNEAISTPPTPAPSSSTVVEQRPSNVVTTTVEWRGGRHGGGAAKAIPPKSTATDGRLLGALRPHNVLVGRRLELDPVNPSPERNDRPQQLGGEVDSLGWDESVPQHLRDARRRQLVAQAARRRHGAALEQSAEGTLPDVVALSNQNDGDAKMLDAEDAKRRREGPTALRTVDTAWFTFSGEPADILSHRSLIATNEDDEVPTRQGPFPGELLAMVLLFVPAHSRREVVHISSVCRFWRYYANFGPQWTRFRLNTWVGGFPKPVAAKLKQRKIVTRSELFEERRRAILESRVENTTARASHWVREGMMLALVVVLLLLSWGLAIGLASAVSGLNTDGKLGSTLFFVFIVLTAIEWIALRTLSHIFFDDTDKIAGAGIYAQALQVAADGSSIFLAGTGGASGFIEGSKTVETVPWVLVVFNIASAVVIGLLWGRVLSSRHISDAETFSAPDIFNMPPQMYGGLPTTMSATKTPGFVRLPAPLTDPRWMILNTSLTHSNGTHNIYRNETDFIAIQEAVLLWFDEGRVSPLFQSPASVAIPSWWNATYGACSSTPDTDPVTLSPNDLDAICGANPNVSSVKRMYAAVSLLLRVVDAHTAIGINPIVGSSASMCASISNPRNGSTAGGVVVAVVGAGGSRIDNSFLFDGIGSLSRNPYSYLSSIQSQSAALPPLYASTTKTYRGVLASNYFSSDVDSLENIWYETAVKQVSGVFDGKTSEAVQYLLSPWSALRCVNGTELHMRVPLVRFDMEGTQVAYSSRAHRLFNAHLGIVIAGLGFVFLVFLATMALPDDFVGAFGSVIMAICAALLSPVTLLVFGVLCIVNGDEVGSGRSGITANTDEVFMCDNSAGAGMVATACVIGFLMLVVFTRRQCSERF